MFKFRARLSIAFDFPENPAPVPMAMILANDNQFWLVRLCAIS
jgi:hypothetical protein